MKILCESSVRHVHLSEKDLKALFGGAAELVATRDLSQPGQFQSDKKVDLVGPKRTIEGVSVLGPTRSQTQVEISRTDCFTLGLKDVPLRQSGYLKDSAGIVMRVGEKEVKLVEGVIVAQRHVHMSPETAKKNDIRDGQVVSVKIDGERGGIFSNVIVRTGPSHSNAIHIDSDEANALGAGSEAEIIV